MLTSNRIDKAELDFLLRYPIVLNVVSPVDFLSQASWGGIKALANMDQFRNLDKDIEVSSLYSIRPNKVHALFLISACLIC